MGVNLRSAKWFEPDNDTGFQHRAALRAEGFTREAFRGRPVIGICNSWSELNNCNVHLRAVADAVKRGVWAAGGFPLEFMTISLGEERIFRLTQPKTKQVRNFPACDGTVFVMPYDTNKVWKHAVPRFARWTGRRISITLRAFEDR